MGESAADAPQGVGRVRLSILGGFRLMDALDIEVAGLGRHERALLAYLCLTPTQRHGRRDLASMLWPDRFDEQARASLRECLWGLRKALRNDVPFLVPNSDPVTLHASGIRVDVIEFEKFVALGTRPALEQAEALYTGDLLTGLDIKAANFEDWLSRERARLQGVAIDALTRLMVLRIEAGEYDSAIETGQRILALDELCEAAHRLLMRVYALDGRRAQALRQYQLCCDLLRQQLKAEPEPETRRLMEEIRRPYEPSISQSVRPTAIAADPPTAVPAETGVATAAETRPSVGPSAPQPRFELWVRLRRHRFSITLAGIVLVVLSTVGYAEWRYWNFPWLAPFPLDYAVVGIRAVIPGPVKRSIAVLPFSYSDEDTRLRAEDLSDGIARSLSTASRVIVSSRDSVLDATAKTDDSAKLSADLGVRYLLDGTVSKLGSDFAVGVRLIDAGGGGQVAWSNNYRGRQNDDVLDLQHRIALEVIASLGVELSATERERLGPGLGTEDMRAWLEANEGETMLRRRSKDDNLNARYHYERALALDPSYALALDGLAWTYLLDAVFEWTAEPAAAIKKANDLAEQAYALGPDRPRTHSLLGYIALLRRDFGAAEAHGRRAVNLAPNDAEAWALLGYTLTFIGDPADALYLCKRALELQPDPPEWHRWLYGRALRKAGNIQDAIATLEAAVASDPVSHIPYVELAAAYSEANDTVKARAVADNVLLFKSDFSVRAWVQQPPYAHAADAQREADVLIRAGLPE